MSHFSVPRGWHLSGKVRAWVHLPLRKGKRSWSKSLLQASYPSAANSLALQALYHIIWILEQGILHLHWMQVRSLEQGN